jgi:hypothetical protein
MDFYTFLDAIEQMANKIYKKDQLSENISNFLQQACSFFETS